MSYFGRIVSATPLGSSVLPVMEHAAKADLCPVYQYSDNWHRKGQLILMFAEHVLPILILKVSTHLRVCPRFSAETFLENL